MPRFLTESDESKFRQELCDAATRLFTERGLAALTMRNIAVELGCSRTTPYRYFRDKSEILATVRAAGFARLADRLNSVGDSGDVIERIRGLGHQYVEFATTEPDVYRLMFEMSRPDVEPSPLLEAEIQRNRMAVRSAADEAVTAGRLHGDPGTLARLYWAGLHGLVELHLDDKFSPDHDLDSLTSAMIDTLLAGMSSTAP